MKVFTHSADCERSVTILPSGAGDLLTLEVATRFPLAQRPVWQRNLQITGDPAQLWELASEIHNAVLAHTLPASK